MNYAILYQRLKVYLYGKIETIQEKRCDSKIIEKWIQDKDVFMRWGGERFGEFPISAEIIDEKYSLNNGDCAEEDNFYPWVALDDENRVVGHFIMRYLHGDNKLLRFGWVIVDDTRRGKGYGTGMLQKGLQYAFDILGADRVTIGVFENNESRITSRHINAI